MAKTAGSSIRSALKQYGCSPGNSRWNKLVHEMGFRRELTALPSGELKHLSAAKVREFLPEMMFADFFKFAFVRNTWDHLVSTYFFILQDSTHEHHAFVKSLAGFDDFIRWQALYPAAPQKNSVADDDGTLLVDFLGRFENLAGDFRSLCQRLQIKAALPHINAGVRRDYRSYYTDRTAALVGVSFREDIEYFGFAFDGEDSRPACLAGQRAGEHPDAGRAVRVTTVDDQPRSISSDRTSTAAIFPNARCFERSQDPCEKGKNSEHQLVDIVAITMLAMLSGAEGWMDIRDWSDVQESWLAGSLALPRGLPSHAVIRRVISRIDPGQFIAFSNTCLAAICDVTDGEPPPGVGNTHRSSPNRRSVETPLQNVIARPENNQIVFGQPTDVAQNSGIPSTAKLIELLDLTGAVVAVDVSDCPRYTAQRIIDDCGNYVLALQGRQNERMRDAVYEALTENLGDDFARLARRHHATRMRDDGRTHERCYYQMEAPPDLVGADDWAAVKTIGLAMSIIQRDGQATEEVRYFLSSLPLSVERFADAARCYWRMESDRQWSLGVIFGDDATQPGHDHGAENLAAARRAAVSLLKSYSGDNRGVRQRRLRAGWDRSYLLHILADTRRPVVAEQPGSSSSP